MPTIRIKEWTKEKLEAVRNEEAHSSFDSVVKALLRDREVARMASRTLDTDDLAEQPREPEEKAFDDLTVLAELSHADEGILFLWCPNCRNEVSHVVTENPVSLSVFETQCQQCLSQLNHHALVVAEIGHPVEEELVDSQLEANLRDCTIDYWDRTLREVGDQAVDVQNEDALVWQFAQYSEQFSWEWPADIPVVGVEVGKQYRNEATDELLAVVERASDRRNDINDLHVEVWPVEGSREDSQPRLLERDDVIELLTDRVLYTA